MPQTGGQPCIPGPGRQDLLGVEGVAAAATRELATRRLGHLIADDGPCQLGDVTVAERNEVDAFVRHAALDLGEEREQRMAPVQLVTSIRREQQDSFESTRLQQRQEELTRRLVRPMQVLDGDREGLMFGEVVQQRPEPVRPGAPDVATASSSHQREFR